ncbi:hypothetical protein RIF29_38002 [Crotalaria pallida]|uniref:Protein kinase domain-containing protein n=1 Tax=Crotalaria pallida TaxID=3830 RepID=A0AAN9HP92_CROPI
MVGFSGIFLGNIQLLLAVKQCDKKGICHGDIKCENVLITSSNWLYLADFASFKSIYIPYDDPSDFSFFFDTGGRRLCYLAPEAYESYRSVNLKSAMISEHQCPYVALHINISDLYCKTNHLVYSVVCLNFFS